MSYFSRLAGRVFCCLIPLFVGLPLGCKKQAPAEPANAVAAKVQTPAVKLPEALPPEIVGWKPGLEKDEQVVDVAGFAAVLVRRDIPADDEHPFSAHSDYYVVTKAGERSGPWKRVAAFAAHDGETFHAYVSEKDYGEWTPLGLAVAESSLYSPPAQEGETEKSDAKEAGEVGLPGVELRKTEETVSVIWKGKELGVWSELGAMEVSPDGKALYFWAKGTEGGWDLYCDGANITSKDAAREPPPGSGGGVVFGSKEGQLAYTEFLTNQDQKDSYGLWLVVGVRRLGPFMSFLPEYSWPAGAASPTYASREGYSWTVTSGQKEYAGNGRYDSVDWLVHDTAEAEPLWSAKVAGSPVGEHQLLLGNHRILFANSFDRPIRSPDGASYVLTAWYRPKSVFSMNSTTYVVLLPQLGSGRSERDQGPQTGAVDDPLLATLRENATALRLLLPPHAGPFGEVKHLRFSKGGRAVAFEAEHDGNAQRLVEARVFDGQHCLIGRLDSDGGAATLLKDGVLVRQTGL